MKINRLFLSLSYLAPDVLATSGLRPIAEKLDGTSSTTDSHHLLQKDSCLGDIDFTLQMEGSCNYELLLSTIGAKLEEEDCTHDAVSELKLLLKLTDDNNVQDEISVFCDEAYRSWEAEYLPFRAITDEDDMFDKEIFDGGTWYNEERQTKDRYGIDIHVFKNDAARLDAVYRQKAQSGGISWPGYITNFEECELRAAMCCFTQDRQANDNNGNCKTPYDENCVEANPGDNTDVCYVDMSRSPHSNHVQFGFAIYESAGEDDSHCHGFAWGGDSNDPSALYKGNNLFYVTMYDHMYKRGYTRNVPGAPKCACVEQMPVVTRADCTEVDTNENIEFFYNAEQSTFAAKIVEVDINYNACNGADDNNNDLSAYYERLVREGKATREEKDNLDEILVGENNCPVAIDSFLRSQWMQRMDGTTVTNFGSGRRPYAQSGKQWERGVGAHTGTVYDDQYWDLKETACGDIDDTCYLIMNHESGRRMYAQKDKVGGQGVGASNNRIYDDQKWILKETSCGDEGETTCYHIENYDSKRQLYALTGYSWESGFGAAAPGEEKPGDVQKWLIDKK